MRGELGQGAAGGAELGVLADQQVAQPQQLLVAGVELRERTFGRSSTSPSSIFASCSWTASSERRSSPTSAPQSPPGAVVAAHRLDKGLLGPHVEGGPGGDVGDVGLEVAEEAFAGERADQASGGRTLRWVGSP